MDDRMRKRAYVKFVPHRHPQDTLLWLPWLSSYLFKLMENLELTNLTREKRFINDWQLSHDNFQKGICSI